jgi:hypothetical protein
MKRKKCSRLIPHLAVAAVLVSTIAVSLGESSTPQPAQARQQGASHASRYEPNHFPKRAAMYYQTIWGVDDLNIRAAESGQLIRFSYRILDPTRAHMFNDIKIEASLIAPTRGVKLTIPSLEKVGLLRQRNTPDAGKRYWMAFSNPRLTVKRGDRVNVVIGQFHADGLVVE